MNHYILEILIKSPTISASGEGFGAVIDTDSDNKKHEFQCQWFFCGNH